MVQLYIDGKGQDLAALSRVNQFFNTPATVWLYRGIVVKLDLMNTIFSAALLRNLLSAKTLQNPIRHYIQHMTISMPATRTGTARCRMRRNVLETIIQVVPKLPNLRTFR